jgi:hypothetical protein
MMQFIEKRRLSCNFSMAGGWRVAGLVLRALDS